MPYAALHLRQDFRGGVLEGHTPVFNDSVESEVLVEWARVLKLWTLPADQAIVEGLIKGALTTAEHHSQVLVEQDAKVPDLIAEYVKSFQPNTLLPEVS